MLTELFTRRMAKEVLGWLFVTITGVSLLELAVFPPGL
jgi:hypothetical protein